MTDMAIDRACLTRSRVTEAVYLEALERGVGERDAQAAAEEVADRLRLPDARGVPPASGFHDLRAEQDFVYPRRGRKVRKRRGQVVMRDPHHVDTIVVHQTAVEFGVGPRLIRQAQGDVELARARRALDVACHAMAFRAGYFVAAHPLRAYVNHAHRLNRRSLGLEVEGRYPGLLDDPSTLAREDLDTTWQGPPTPLTEQTVQAARAALAWLVEEGRTEGMPIRFIRAHRQSSHTRRADPGQALWRRLVLDFAIPRLGLQAKRDAPWAQGRPVPLPWDPDGIGEY